MSTTVRNISSDLTPMRVLGISQKLHRSSAIWKTPVRKRIVLPDTQSAKPARKSEKVPRPIQLPTMVPYHCYYTILLHPPHTLWPSAVNWYDDIHFMSSSRNILYFRCDSVICLRPTAFVRSNYFATQAVLRCAQTYYGCFSPCLNVQEDPCTERKTDPMPKQQLFCRTVPFGTPNSP